MADYSYSGAAGAVADELHSLRERREDEPRKRSVEEREEAVKQIEQAIRDIQANTSLSPQEKSFRIGEAQKKISALYEPHEGHQLLQRMKQIFSPPTAPVTASTTTASPAVKVGDATLPAGPTKKIELRPGMTLADVLGAAGPAPDTKPIHTMTGQGDDGKQYVWSFYPDGRIDKQEIPGASSKSEFEQLDDQYFKLFNKHLTEDEFKQKVGLTPKPTTGKEPKVEVKEGAVILEDPENNKTYTSLDQIPKDRKDLQGMFKDMQASIDKKAKEKQEEEDKRFNRQLELISDRFQVALKKKDYDDAKKEITLAQRDYNSAVERQNTMHDNLREATTDPSNQQAMLSMVANHIGMTLGAQKGARITRAVWEEAVESRPWLSGAKASFVVGSDGVEILQGVVLTQKQMESMVELADDKVEVFKKNLDTVKSQYQDALDVKDEGKKGGKSESKGKTHHFTEGADSWDIPEAKVEAFKKKHPNAKEQ